LTWLYAAARLFWILRKPDSLLYKSIDRPAFSFFWFPLATPQLISKTRIDGFEIKGLGRSNVRFAAPARGLHK
jgi:hypothetical protein